MTRSISSQQTSQRLNSIKMTAGGNVENRITIMNESMIISGLCFGGYRSFGETQHFEHLSKVNLFIGPNNSGKSNIIRFISEKLSTLAASRSVQLSDLDKPLISTNPFCVGIPFHVTADEEGIIQGAIDLISQRTNGNHNSQQLSGYLTQVFQKKAQLGGTDHAWFHFNAGLSVIRGSWETAFEELSDNEIRALWSALKGSRGGDRMNHWFPESLDKIIPKFREFAHTFIPAVRQIGAKGTTSSSFSGDGIIERLIRLQNPDVHNQVDRKKFQKINLFIQNVTSNSSAEIEIPHDRDTILVHMDGKTLPLESLGTGIHEVIILASAATILEGNIICMEEPELHLNPILQKKLVRYLQSNTSNQYFITTHSASLMDTADAEIYQISINNGNSTARRVTSDRVRSEVCHELGYTPSDLLQSNCIIWVEGPSDRIYINNWISKMAPELIEGIHYSIMFYGGRLASHLSASDTSGELSEFISLRRLNQRGVIVIDSDRSKAGEKINSTKLRLKKEFDEGPGFAWVTAGREIENYIPAENLKAAISKAHPTATTTSSFSKHSNSLKIKTKSNKHTQASKVKVSKYVTESVAPDFSNLGLGKEINRLVKFIKMSNPDSGRIDSNGERKEVVP